MLTIKKVKAPDNFQISFSLLCRRSPNGPLKRENICINHYATFLIPFHSSNRCVRL